MSKKNVLRQFELTEKLACTLHIFNLEKKVADHLVKEIKIDNVVQKLFGVMSGEENTDVIIADYF